jgi:uncharacterized membrane protein
MNNKQWTFAAGLATGAGALFLLDPQRGGRRRALVRDKLVRAAHKGADAVDATARDFSQRAQGIAAEARARLRSQDVDDDVLVARVRSKVGRVLSHPHAVRVEATDGRVVLEGPVLAHELNDLLSAVWRVRGVADVENRLQVYHRPGDIPSLQGGAPRPGERYELMQENWSPTARLLAGACGGSLIAWGLTRRDAAGIGLLALGAALAARGATNLEFRRLIGVGAGRRAIDLQKTIHVSAPVEEVFAFWRDYTNFPKFMTNVREVRPTAAEGQSHWVVSGPAGIPVEFDTVVTGLVPNELIAWKTVEGSPVAHAGIIRFEPTRDGGTRVHIRMSYNPPAGALGAALASLIGADPKTKLDEDLIRMKTFIETGRVAHDAADRERPTGTAGTSEPALPVGDSMRGE